MTKVSYSVRYLPQSDNNRFLILQKFRSKKATNFVFYAFLLYGNFFELTRDLKKHFCKLNFDKSMIYSWHLKHPQLFQLDIFFTAYNNATKYAWKKYYPSGPAVLLFLVKCFMNVSWKRRGIRIRMLLQEMFRPIVYSVYPWKQKKHVIL